MESRFLAESHRLGITVWHYRFGITAWHYSGSPVGITVADNRNNRGDTIKRRRGSDRKWLSSSKVLQCVHMETNPKIAVICWIKSSLDPDWSASQSTAWVVDERSVNSMFEKWSGCLKRICHRPTSTVRSPPNIAWCSSLL